MLSSNHHLFLYAKLITVLNKEVWQSMKYKLWVTTQHHFITQYISLRCTAVNEFCRMIRMGVAGHVRGNRRDQWRMSKVHSLSSGKVAAPPPPHLKIRHIAIFAFYSLNYSLAARLQDNSHSKSPTKVETEKTVAIYCLWMVDNGQGREWWWKKKTFRLKLHSISSVGTITSLCLHKSLCS